MRRKRKEVLLGNEAIGLGLVEAGVRLVSAYPGTPSSEILPATVRFAKAWGLKLYAEWSTNEKVAFDQAYAAAMAGKRAACCMKQVGLNVAYDSVMSAAYTGVVGGLVIISCDDPGPHSSQTEQDSRRMAWMAKIPVLDPASPQEARAMGAEAFRISERFRIPVMLRSVTRLSHARQDVEMGPVRARESSKARFVRDVTRWAATPRFRYILHRELNQKLARIARTSERLTRLALPGKQLQADQEGDHPGIGEPVVAEIEMSGMLPPEDRVLPAHQGLDQGMAHPRADRPAAASGDRLRHRLGADQVVEDGRALLLGQEALGHERRNHVPAQGIGLLVHEEHPVRVPVEGRTQVGLLL